MLDRRLRAKSRRFVKLCTKASPSGVTEVTRGVMGPLSPRPSGTRSGSLPAPIAPAATLSRLLKLGKTPLCDHRSPRPGLRFVRIARNGANNSGLHGPGRGEQRLQTRSTLEERAVKRFASRLLRGRRGKEEPPTIPRRVDLCLEQV